MLTRLDFGNSVLADLPVYLVRRLPTVGAECGCATDVSSPPIRPHHRRVSLSPLAARAGTSSVQRLPSRHKVLHGLTPQYLGPLDRVADLPGRRALRSSGTNRLVVPPDRLSTVANRAFPVVGSTNLERSTG